MPRRRRRPPISVTLVLPAEPPTQDEIDIILMGTDAIINQAGRSGLTLILNGSRSKKALEFEDWQEAGQPERVWPRLETIHRDIKFMLLEAIGERGRRDLTPVLQAWFSHEVRTAVNRTLQSLGQRTLPHPDRKSAQSKR